MIFLLSKLTWLLLRPSTVLLLLGLVGLVIAWRRRARPRERLGLGLMTLSLGGFALILVLSLNQVLIRPLEDRFPPPATPPADVAGIVVLGGAVERELSLEHDRPALNAAAERMTEFVALARRYPHARLAFTGGSGSVAPDGSNEADMARRLFDALGLADRGVVYEDRSRNTVENAQFLYRLMQPKPGEIWILVTSASHMPRSVGVFRKAGWTVLPWPVGFKGGTGLRVIYGSALGEKLDQFDWATHEWFGLLAYWLLGRTDALFPAPRPPSPGA
jgi:uncharacterized SAM-binding protein YcdF (DUF218 family)